MERSVRAISPEADLEIRTAIAPKVPAAHRSHSIAFGDVPERPIRPHSSQSVQGVSIHQHLDPMAFRAVYSSEAGARRGSADHADYKQMYDVFFADRPLVPRANFMKSVSRIWKTHPVGQLREMYQALASPILRSFPATTTGLRGFAGRIPEEQISGSPSGLRRRIHPDLAAPLRRVGVSGRRPAPIRYGATSAPTRGKRKGRQSLAWKECRAASRASPTPATQAAGRFRRSGAPPWFVVLQHGDSIALGCGQTGEGDPWW